MIMRKTATTAYDDVTMVDFNLTQYHDTSVTVGITYTFKVIAMNATSTSSPRRLEAARCPVVSSAGPSKPARTRSR